MSKRSLAVETRMKDLFLSETYMRLCDVPLEVRICHVKRVPYHVFTNMNAVTFVKTRNGVSKNAHVPARLDISASLWARTRKVKAERVACHPCPRFHRVCGLSWERADCTDKSNGLNIDGQMMKRMAYR
jgi:hypothetical protein